jgi:hypothetical protein
MLADPALSDAIEADLMREYRVDLRQLRTGELRVRQVLVYVKGLPYDCAFRRASAARAAASEARSGPKPAPSFATASDLAGLFGSRKG